MDVMDVYVHMDTNDWPDDAEEKYSRLEILGKGSFGMVWMALRKTEPENADDEEYVAVKTISIKDEKGKVYAEREISILQELKHPNVIRLIRAYPVYGVSRVVVMQLARGPNLHQLIVKRGALGLPLARLVSRQLIAAVSYLHGRAVIHRDIKPSNCILASNDILPVDDYDWYLDDAIWSNDVDGEDAVKQHRWKLMLVDFGFARALEKEEIDAQKRKLRNSIAFESKKTPPVTTTTTTTTTASTVVNSTLGNFRNINDRIAEDDESEASDVLNKIAEIAALNMRSQAFEPTNEMENEIMGSGKQRQRLSGVSMPIPETTQTKEENGKRFSTTRHKVRSMSALGTKAYAAPEIRKKLRHKTKEDFGMANAAMTECVADYGMIVDAYSVGWTLRVAMTGVPPDFTISEYMRERNIAAMEAQDEILPEGACCCFGRVATPVLRVRDPSMIPHEATLLIASMTERNPEDRMTVREAQNHPWIAGSSEDDRYFLPQGNVPSKHGDPVVPLECAASLSKLTTAYHMQ